MTQSKVKHASKLLGADPLSEFRSSAEWLHINRHFWEVSRSARPILMWPKIKLPRDGSLLELAALARVPAKHREKLCQAVSSDIDREWYWLTRPQAVSRKRALLQLGRLAELLSEICAIFRDLNESAVLALERTSLLPRTPEREPPLSEYDLAHYKRMTAALAGQSLDALALRRQSKPSRGRGRPAGGELKRPGEPGSLARFTLRLLWDVEANGGQLTLDKTRGKGTLLEGLNLLRSHLPPKFVPNALPLSTLARIKALAAKVLGQKYPIATGR